MRYRLTVRDELSDRLARAFGPVETERLDGTTRITMDVTDQADLVGIVGRLGDFGIELIALDRVALVRTDPAEQG